MHKPEAAAMKMLFRKKESNKVNPLLAKVLPDDQARRGADDSYQAGGVHGVAALRPAAAESAPSIRGPPLSEAPQTGVSPNIAGAARKHEGAEKSDHAALEPPNVVGPKQDLQAVAVGKIFAARSLEKSRQRKKEKSRQRVCVHAGLGSVAFVGLLVWTIMSEGNQPTHQPSNRTSFSEVYPVALLEKYCDHVNSRELEGSFQNPHFLIVISFFAPVVFALYEMAMHLIKLHADVVNAGGKFASSCLESAAAHSRSCILRMLFVCTPARLQKSVANKVGEIKDSTTEQGLNAIDKQIVGHNEGLEEKSSEFQAQANEVFGIELNESEDTESATYEEYKLKQATDEEAREAEMAQSIGFALIHLGLALAVAVDYTNRINSVAVGQSAMCRASKVLVMPLFTAFAISVWNVLMTITNYVHWEWSRQKSPKDVVSDNLIPAPLRPVHRNFLATTVLLTTSAALGIWICAALVVAPALFGFLPVVLALLIAVPLLILVLPLALISWIWGLIPDSVAHLENRQLNALHAVFSRPNGDGQMVIIFTQSARMSYTIIGKEPQDIQQRDQRMCSTLSTSFGTSLTRIKMGK